MYHTGFEPGTTKTVKLISTNLPLRQDLDKIDLIVLMINTHIVDQSENISW